MTDREVYEKAVLQWGEASQLDMAIEECAELIVALQHWKRERIGTDKVIEEIADVEIMMGQLRVMFDGEKVDWRHRGKIQRLKERLKRARNQG
jgi:hypothetical protein